MASKNGFRLPKRVRIVDRSSSITNAFINGIIPVRVPSDADVAEVLALFGMHADDVRCVYCGDKSSEWDHFRPLIVAKEPTGYITEIQNLVPACNKCNQSKGNSDWQAWMMGNAMLSPRSRNIHDIHERVERLSRFERWREPTQLAIPDLVGEQMWSEYRSHWRALLDDMRETQRLALQVQRKLHSTLGLNAATNTSGKRSVSIETNMTPAEQEMLESRIRIWASRPHLNVHRIIGIVVNSGGVIAADALVEQIAMGTPSSNPAGAVAGLLTSRGNAYGRVLQRRDRLICLHPNLEREILAHDWHRDAAP